MPKNLLYPSSSRTDLTDLDYAKEQNLAHDWICPGLRVSTGMVGTCTMAGRSTYVETYIFSDVSWFKTQPVYHETRSVKQAVHVHGRIVANLLDKALRQSVNGEAC